MFSRKSMFVALTVLMMLTMLVPAAMAAPEWTHGVEIIDPTTADPIYIDPNSADNTFDVKVELAIVGTQVHDVHIVASLLDDYSNEVASAFVDVQSENLVPGTNAVTLVDFVAPVVDDGWYDLMVCAQDIDEVGGPQGPEWCTLEPDAVAIDKTWPEVLLTKPALNDAPVWVTGKAYELYGDATDNFMVVAAWFEYSADPNTDDWKKIGNENAAGVGQDAALVAGSTYKAKWDTTAVPDDAGWIQFCAIDEVDHVSCSGPQAVMVENRVTLNLVAGWNLVSTPLMLYNSQVASALDHLIAKGEVDKVYAYDNATDKWSFWKLSGPDGLKTIDHGKGYWVHVITPTELTFVGTWMDPTMDDPSPATPPQYGVGTGWNLIGFTHWGTPTDQASTVDDTVQEYLGVQLAPAVESMYGYNAANHLYYQMYLGSTMTEGAGYWLALAQPGTINP